MFFAAPVDINEFTHARAVFAGEMPTPANFLSEESEEETRLEKTAAFPHLECTALRSIADRADVTHGSIALGDDLGFRT